MTALLVAALEVVTGVALEPHHVAKLGHGVVARDLGDGDVEVMCEPAPETNAQRVERLTHELDAAKTALRLERAAKRVNAQRRGAR